MTSVVALSCGIHEGLREIDPCPECARAFAEIEEEFRLHWVYDPRGGTKNRGCWRPRKRSEYPMPKPPKIDETPREDPDDLPHQAARRVQAGESYWQVARHMGVESETVQLWCRRAGVVEEAGASDRHMREHRDAIRKAREERARKPIAATPEPTPEPAVKEPAPAAAAPPVLSKRGGRKSTVVRGVRLSGEALAQARAEAVAFVASGKSYYRAATKFGVSHTTLRVWCAQAGVVSTQKQGRSEGYMAMLAEKQAALAPEPEPVVEAPIEEPPLPEPEPVVEAPEPERMPCEDVGEAVRSELELDDARETNRAEVYRRCGRRYTDEQVRSILETMVAESLSIKETAARFDVAPNVIGKWAADNGIVSPCSRFVTSATPETKAAAVERVRDGESLRSVGDSLGMSHKAIRRWCEDAGVSTAHHRVGAGVAHQPRATKVEVPDEPVDRPMSAAAWSFARKRLQAGTPLAEIASLIHVSEAVLRRRFGMLAAPKPKRSPEEILANLPPNAHPLAIRESALAQVREGKSMKDTARDLNVSTSTVSRWCDDAGIVSIFKSSLTDEGRAAIVAHVASGKSVLSAAKRFQVSRVTIRAICDQAHLDALTKSPSPAFEPDPAVVETTIDRFRDAVPETPLPEEKPMPTETSPEGEPLTNADLIDLLGLPARLTIAARRLDEAARLARPEEATLTLDFALAEIEAYKREVLAPRLRLRR